MPYSNSPAIAVRKAGDADSSQVFRRASQSAPTSMTRALFSMLAIVLPFHAVAQPPVDQGKIERGRYLVNITGCNDCHTKGHVESGGKIAESKRLQGHDTGWQGPWGTTYATNLRQYFSAIDEDQWAQYAKKMKARPPMPWFSVNEMNDDDLRAVHAYIRSLGPSSQAVPQYLPPGKEPPKPVFRFVGSPPPARVQK
jgi:mono/diheme cytochrome c family protein